MRIEHLAGGDLSEVVLVVREDGERFAVKRSPDSEGEAAMLRAIRDAGAPTPTVQAERDGWLALEFVDNDGCLERAWGDIGAKLRTLHAARGGGYGHDRDSRFGPVAVENRPAANWHDFWAECRLLCHAGHIDDALRRRVEAVANRLGAWIAADPPPVLLHGDLWTGNLLVRDGRLAALIDPACYYGDAEVDLAMLALFGSPGSAFWEAYDAPASGWDERRALYQLWPALVHLRLFGPGYRAMVEGRLAALGC